MSTFPLENRKVRTQLPRVSRVEALPTIADILTLAEVVAADPQVLACDELLDRPVRWAHVSELVDIADLLQGSELILTTGINLPDTHSGLRAYVGTLCDAGAAALVVELGRRFSELPSALVSACVLRSLPLIAFRRETPFVQVTEAIAALIMGGQDALLRAADQAHEVFTSLCIRGAKPQEIVAELATMAHCPAVFENPLHRVAAWASGGADVGDLLVDWSVRSRRFVTRRPTDTASEEGWLVVSVEARNQVWGRLMLIPPGTPTATQRMLVERAGVALTLVRLLDHDRESLELHAHRAALADLIHGRFASSTEMQQRLDAIGVETRGQDIAGVVVRRNTSLGAAASDARAASKGLEAVAQMARDLNLRAVIGEIRDRSLSIMLVGPTEDAIRRDLHRLSELVHSRFSLTIGMGSVVKDFRHVGRSFHEAEQVSRGAAGRVERPFFELPDLQLRGLMHLIAPDPRLQSFVERALGPLLDLDERTGSNYVTTLRHYLESSHNRTKAAASAHLSRQSFYQRLARIEELLGVDLQDSETCASLYVAVLALDSSRTSA